MSYKSENETDKFIYDDCYIGGFSHGDDGIMLTLGALIVKADNSQNSNYTDSYADTLAAKFVGGRLLGGVRDGYKYYDANEVLQREVPDYVLSDGELADLTEKLEGAYLYEVKKDDDTHFILGIEFTDAEDNTVGDSYRLRLVCDSAEYEWERYLNRVQRI